MIILYTKDNCLACEKAKEYLNSLGIFYEEIKVDKNFNGQKPEVVPFLKLPDGAEIKGFHPLIYSRIFGEVEKIFEEWY